MLQLKMWMRSKQKGGASEEFPPAFNKITKFFSLQFAGDEMVMPKELKKQIVDALRFDQPGSSKMLPEGSTFCDPE